MIRLSFKLKRYYFTPHLKACLSDSSENISIDLESENCIVLNDFMSQFLTIKKKLKNHSQKINLYKLLNYKLKNDSV